MTKNPYVDSYSHEYFFETYFPKRTKAYSAIGEEYREAAIFVARVGALLSNADGLYYSILMGGGFDTNINPDRLETLGATPKERMKTVDKTISKWLDAADVIDPLVHYHLFLDHMSMKKSPWSEEMKLIVAVRFFATYWDALNIMIENLGKDIALWKRDAKDNTDELAALHEQLSHMVQLYAVYLNRTKLHEFFKNLIEGDECKANFSDENFGEDGFQLEHDFLFE